MVTISFHKNKYSTQLVTKTHQKLFKAQPRWLGFDGQCAIKFTL